MPTVHDVAGYLLWLADRDRSGIDHLKLQKLVYYAQAFHLGSEGEALFNETLHAWRYGPASPDLWSRECYRRGLIEPPDASGEEAFSDRQRELVELVYERFRDLSGIELVHRTHEEAPWQQATERSRDGGDDTITHEQMRLYYRDRLAVLAEHTEFPPLEAVIDLGPLEDVAAGVLPQPLSAPRRDRPPGDMAAVDAPPLDRGRRVRRRHRDFEDPDHARSP